jgi:hypothetical protein
VGYEVMDGERKDGEKGRERDKQINKRRRENKRTIIKATNKRGKKKKKN